MRELSPSKVHDSLYRDSVYGAAVCDVVLVRGTRR